MFINLKTLFQLPVYTLSGKHLGKVKDAELDTDAHQVRKYIVRSGLLGGAQYLVTPNQIRSISAEKIVVDDALIKINIHEPAAKEKTSPALSGATSAIKNS